MTSDREASGTETTRRGWVLVPWDEVPSDWTDEAVPMALLPFAPGELRSLLDRSPVEAELLPDERELARAVARGLTVGDIARLLGIDRRTAERRLARLRSKMGATTKSELVALLAGRGF